MAFDLDRTVNAVTSEASERKKGGHQNKRFYGYLRLQLPNSYFITRCLTSASTGPTKWPCDPNATDCIVSPGKRF